MPVRLIGFFRMAHVSGWGTRTGAYAGALEGGPSDVLVDERATSHGPLQQGTTLVAARPTVERVRVDRPSQTRRRFNAQAGVPYLIGATIFFLEVYLIVTL